MPENNPTPSEAILQMQERHKQALELNGILDKVIGDTVAHRPQDAVKEISEGYPVVLGTTHEDTTQIYVAFQNEAGIGADRRLTSRIVRIGAIAAGTARPNVLIGITDTDFAIVRSLYKDVLYHKEHVAPEYNTELGL
jgi:carboxylesterase type B